MSSRSPIVPVDAIRNAAATRAAATSIRQVAHQVGVTTRGLNLFLNGAEPYAKNLAKLQQWYVRQAAELNSVTDAVTAAAAMIVLTHDMPPAKRTAVIADSARWWSEKYAALGLPQPEWIKELQARINPPSTVGGSSPSGQRRRRS
jgi:hypothetical protein